MPSLADHFKDLAQRLSGSQGVTELADDYDDERSEQIRNAAIASVDRAWEVARKKGEEKLAGENKKIVKSK